MLSRHHSKVQSTVPVYHVHRPACPIQIDGQLDEFDWIAADRLRLVKLKHVPEDGLPLRENTYISSLWDDQRLYIGFVIQDRDVWATLLDRDARLFPEECVEFFIDPDGDGQRYVEAQINSLNNMRDLLVDGSIQRPTREQYDLMAKWDFCHVDKAVKIFRDLSGSAVGWTLEIGLPWSELDFSHRTWPPRPGDTLRINFCRYERDSKCQLPLELSGWSDVGANFHSPNRFGVFIFSSSVAGSQEG